MLMNRHIVHDMEDNLHFPKNSLLLQCRRTRICMLTFRTYPCERIQAVVHADSYGYDENQVATNLNSLVNLSWLS